MERSFLLPHTPLTFASYLETQDRNMKIQIINGPNLNLLGKREPGVYGNQSFEDFFATLRQRYPAFELHYYQSNVEGELVNKLHERGFDFDGIIINAGAYTHTSVALHDAIGAIRTPVVEVHISNVYAREEFRHKSLITSKCAGMLTGFGMEGYALALEYFKHKSPAL
jgi:3-dehydroquinate dehydratase-2